MSRECRKCGKIIPTRMIIEGKQLSLQNRKFCLECSPYRGKNTSPNDPIIRKPRTWKSCSEERKNLIKESLYKRALTRRDELLKKHGCKCQVCGYDKCKRALSFHHRDPSTKLFGLALNNLWSKTQELIDAESDKCDLLCLNCHTELEDKIARETNIVQKVNKRYGTNF